jgi:hypothetical protein
MAECLVLDVPLALRNVCFWGERVAKLFAALRTRNNRIRLNVFCLDVARLGSSLNQYCSLVAKIVLQHIRGKSGHQKQGRTRRTKSGGASCVISTGQRYTRSRGELGRGLINEQSNVGVDAPMSPIGGKADIARAYRHFRK